MSNDPPRNDSWNDDAAGEEVEMDEAAVYDSQAENDLYEQDWNDETDPYLTENEVEDTDAVDASFYEPPVPPLTDEEVASDLLPEDDYNWLRENWWRLAIVIILLALIIVLLARACSGGGNKQSSQPVPIATHAIVPTFTSTPAVMATTTLQSGAALNDNTPVVQPATITPPATAAPPAGKFSVGQIVIVTGTGKDRLSFRDGPGTNSEIQRIIKDGVKLEVIGGPEEADGLTWWQLKTPKGYIGWAAEDFLRPQ